MLNIFSVIINWVNSSRSLTISLEDIGITSGTATDLWTGSSVGTLRDTYVPLTPHKHIYLNTPPAIRPLSPRTVQLFSRLLTQRLQNPIRSLTTVLAHRQPPLLVVHLSVQSTPRSASQVTLVTVEVLPLLGSMAAREGQNWFRLTTLTLISQWPTLRALTAAMLWWAWTAGRAKLYRCRYPVKYVFPIQVARMCKDFSSLLRRAGTLYTQDIWLRYQDSSQEKTTPSHSQILTLGLPISIVSVLRIDELSIMKSYLQCSCNLLSYA